ncbi:MAG: hypothetical protein WA710_09850 [Pseudolabrys sp.]
MKLDASLARKTAAWPISSGSQALQQMLRSRRSSCCFHIAKAFHQTVGFDRPRRQGVNPHVLRRVIGRHGFGKLDQCTLGRAIDRTARPGDATELRGNMNDAAAARLDHRRQDRATHQECATDIYGEHFVPVGETEFQHRAVGVMTGRTIDQNVNLGRPGEDRLGRRLDFGFIAHVADNCERSRTDRGRRCRCGRLVQIDTGDFCARFRKC